MNNIIYNLPFLLFFIPLIGSILTSLITNKKINVGITITSMFMLLITLIYMIFAYQTGSTTYVNIKDNISLLGAEYRLNIFNVYVAFLLIITYIFMFITTNYEISGKVMNYNKYRRFFFSTYLLNIFSAIGILFTSNICNYFIFLEIYTFTIYTIISNSNNKNNLMIAYSTFNQNIVSSLLILLSIFGFVLYFNNTNMLIIYQKFLTINILKNPVILLLILFYMIGILLKFFSLNIYSNIYSSYKNEKILNNNLIYFLNLFINILLGSYCLIFFSNYLFNLGAVFSGKVFANTIIIVASLLILTSFIMLIKMFNIVNTFINFLFIDFVSIIILIILNNEFSLYLSFLLIAEHSLVNLAIFLIANILYKKYNDCESDLLNNEPVLKYSFIVILLVKIGIPLSFLFSYNYHYIVMASAEKNLLLYIPFILIKIIYIFVIYKIIMNTDDCEKEVAIDYDEKKINLLTYSLYGVMTIVFMLIFLCPTIKNLIGF